MRPSHAISDINLRVWTNHYFFYLCRAGGYLVSVKSDDIDDSVAAQVRTDILAVSVMVVDVLPAEEQIIP
jgi:hypothetical protein